MSKVTSTKGSLSGAKASGSVGKGTPKSGNKSAPKSSSSNAKPSSGGKTTSASGNKSASTTKGTGKSVATQAGQKIDKGTQGGKHDISSLLGIDSPFIKTGQKKIDKTPQDKVNKKKADSKKMNKIADKAKDITGGAEVKQKKDDKKVKDSKQTKDKKPASLESSAGGKVSAGADKKKTDQKKELGKHAQDITGGVDIKGNKKEQGKKLQDTKGKDKKSSPLEATASASVGKGKLEGTASAAVGKEKKSDFKNILDITGKALDAKNLIDKGKAIIDTGKAVKETFIDAAGKALDATKYEGKAIIDTVKTVKETFKEVVNSKEFKEAIDMNKYKLKEMGGIIGEGGSLVSKISELNSMNPESLQIQKAQKEKGPAPPMTVTTGTPLNPTYVPVDKYINYLDPSKSLTKEMKQDALGRLDNVNHTFTREANQMPVFDPKGAKIAESIGEAGKKARQDKGLAPSDSPYEKFDKQVNQSKKDFQKADNCIGEAREALQKGDVKLYNQKLAEAMDLSKTASDNRDLASSFREKVREQATRSRETMEGAAQTLTEIAIGVRIPPMLTSEAKVAKGADNVLGTVGKKQYRKAFEAETKEHSREMGIIMQERKARYVAEGNDPKKFIAEDVHDMGKLHGKGKTDIAEGLLYPIQKRNVHGEDLDLVQGVLDKVNPAIAKHNKEQHHLLFTHGVTREQMMEGASDTIHAWRQDRSLYRKEGGWSFAKIEKTIEEGKYTPSQKQALREALDVQKDLEGRELITKHFWGVDDWKFLKGNI